MKSPWTLVVQLVSRRRESNEVRGKPDREVEAPGTGGDIKALPMPAPELIPERDIQIPSAEQLAVGIEPSAPAQAKSDAAALEPERESLDVVTAVGGSAETGGPEGEPATENGLPALPASSRPRKTGALRSDLARHPAQNVAPIEDVRSPQLLPRAGGTGNSLRDLDMEIALLRKQLAEKLRLQNAQLRALLKRYDRK